MVRDVAAALPMASQSAHLRALRDVTVALSVAPFEPARVEARAVEAARSACALSGIESPAAEAAYARAFLAVARGELRPITLASLRALNETLLGPGHGAGRARERASALLRNGRPALFLPPPAVTRQSLERSCVACEEAVVHGTRSLWLVAPLLHLDVARAQLFPDANGRLGMLAARIVLAQDGPNVQALLPLERALLERPSEYWDRLQQAMRSRGAVDGWLAFMIERYARAAELAL